MCITVERVAANNACTTNNHGATNKNVNSIGSVTPQNIAVKVTGTNNPRTFFLFCGLAVE
ncbi:hypothetical protein SDC9_109297 [bioreactor metagenome]|uniref:Uncharacterized protein n=1 Tax=bioreactor metagenome TaxID=1076179 RepID=A0A645BBF2_9ZZZZ